MVAAGPEADDRGGGGVQAADAVRTKDGGVGRRGSAQAASGRLPLIKPPFCFLFHRLEFGSQVFIVSGIGGQWSGGGAPAAGGPPPPRSGCPPPRAPGRRRREGHSADVRRASRPAPL